jgi:hypothetical protein
MEVAVDSLQSLVVVLKSLPRGATMRVVQSEDPRLNLVSKALEATFEGKVEAYPSVIYLGYRPDKSYYSEILCKYLLTR